MQSKKPRKPHPIENRLTNNKAKRKFYLTNPQIHPQVEISGHRTSGAKWQLVCDEGMVEILTKLNNKDYNTLFSCQGNSDTGGHQPTYITLRYPASERKFVRLVDILKQYYSDRIIQAQIAADGMIAFYIWYPYDFDSRPDKQNDAEYQQIIYQPELDHSLLDKVDNIEKRLQRKN